MFSARGSRRNNRSGGCGYFIELSKSRGVAEKQKKKNNAHTQKWDIVHNERALAIHVAWIRAAINDALIRLKVGTSIRQVCMWARRKLRKMQINILTIENVTKAK